MLSLNIHLPTTSMKNFLLSPEPIDRLQDLCCESVPPHGYFYYSSDLHFVKVTGSKSGYTYYLIGHAIQTEPSAPDPETVLREETFTHIEHAIASWSGRYALITLTSIYTDALILMRLYYLFDEQKILISNSLMLIQQTCTTLTCRKSFNKEFVVWKTSIDWIPGPGTVFKEVSCVMYDYHIEKNGNIYILRKNTESETAPYIGKSTEQLLEWLDERVYTYFMNLQRTFKHILIPLTGGHDSRTTVSYALKYSIPFSCYTCHKKDIKPYDRFLPRKICRDMHIPHTYVRKRLQSSAEKKHEPSW